MCVCLFCPSVSFFVCYFCCSFLSLVDWFVRFWFDVVLMSVLWVISSFFRLFIRGLDHSFFRSFIRSFDRSIDRPFIHLFVRLFHWSLFRWLVGWCVPSFLRSFVGFSPLFVRFPLHHLLVFITVQEFIAYSVILYSHAYIVNVRTSSCKTNLSSLSLYLYPVVSG